MKKFLIVFLFMVNIQQVCGQSTMVGYLITEQSVIVASDNINSTKNYSPFGVYGSVIVNSPYYFPYYSVSSVYPNRLGVNYAILQNGLNLGLGGKIIVVPNYNYEYFFDVTIRVHPIKMITQNNNSFDISLILNISNIVDYGVGLSFPINTTKR